MAKKYYLDKRVTVSGRQSKIDQDNVLDLNAHIQSIITENPNSGSIVTFDNTLTGDLTATNVQDAIDEFSWLATEWSYATVNISAAELQTMGSAPIELLPAPGAGRYYDVRSITLIFSTTGAPVSYNFGATNLLLISATNIALQIDNAALITGLPSPLQKNIVTITSSSPTILESNGVTNVPVFEMNTYLNKPLVLTNVGSVDSAGIGNGTMTVKIEYKVNYI